MTRDPVSLAIVAMANTVPLVLVLAGISDAGGLLVIYWFEWIVAGCFALLRILCAANLGWGGRMGGACLFIVAYSSFVFPSFGALAYGIEASFDLGKLQWIAVAALALVHGEQFLRHYLLGGGREAPADKPIDLVLPTLVPVMVGMTLLFFVAGIAYWLDMQRGVPVVLVALKTGADVLMSAARRPADFEGLE